MRKVEAYVVIVGGGDIAAMDAVIDRNAQLEGRPDTDSKVICWVD